MDASFVRVLPFLISPPNHERLLGGERLGHLDREMHGRTVGRQRHAPACGGGDGLPILILDPKPQLSDDRVATVLHLRTA